MKNCLKILIIDDNKIDCFINQKIIQLYDHSVKTKIFNSALSALEFLSNKVINIHDDFFGFPDIILLDINMPQMNGFSFLDELSKLESFIRNPKQVFFLSSSSLSEDVEKAISKKYCSGYVNKPLTKEKIKNIIYPDYNKSINQ